MMVERRICPESVRAFSGSERHKLRNCMVILMLQALGLSDHVGVPATVFAAMSMPCYTSYLT